MINFYKYHGSGNDFIMINNIGKNIIVNPEQVKLLCDRHFGVGADGLILLQESNKAECFMDYYNSDGTLAEMCGNGIRCTAKFFLSETYPRGELNIGTRAGVKNIICNSDDTYSVDMGAPVFLHSDFPEGTTTLEGFDFNCVSMGNPHAVAMVDDLDIIDVKEVGPKIENNEIFPNKINVEFVQKMSENYFKVKVWERGCGVTLACGTGACAVFSIINKFNKSESLSIFGEEITLEFPGGNLFLSENKDGHIILRGPAEFVFKGEIEEGI